MLTYFVTTMFVNRIKCTVLVIDSGTHETSIPIYKILNIAKNPELRFANE